MRGYSWHKILRPDASAHSISMYLSCAYRGLRRGFPGYRMRRADYPRFEVLGMRCRIIIPRIKVFLSFVHLRGLGTLIEVMKLNISVFPNAVAYRTLRVSKIVSKIAFFALQGSPASQIFGNLDPCVE